MGKLYLSKEDFDKKHIDDKVFTNISEGLSQLNVEDLKVCLFNSGFILG